MNPTKERAGFGSWRWVHYRKCDAGHTIRILGGSTKRAPSLPPGAIYCPRCERDDHRVLVKF